MNIFDILPLILLGELGIFGIVLLTIGIIGFTLIGYDMIRSCFNEIKGE